VVARKGTVLSFKDSIEVQEKIMRCKTK